MPAFIKQAVPIRYTNRDKLEEELNKVLGKGNWGDIEVGIPSMGSIGKADELTRSLRIIIQLM